MHIFVYFALVGSTLLGLLFYADANLAPRGPLAVTTEFQGLPAPWRGPAVQNLATAAAPVPDMNSEAVLAARPKPAPSTVAAAATDAASAAEAAPKRKKHVARRAVPIEPRPRIAWQVGGPFGGYYR